MRIWIRHQWRLPVKQVLSCQKLCAWGFEAEILWKHNGLLPQLIKLHLLAAWPLLLLENIFGGRPPLRAGHRCEVAFISETTRGFSYFSKLWFPAENFRIFRILLGLQFGALFIVGFTAAIWVFSWRGFAGFLQGFCLETFFVYL